MIIIDGIQYEQTAEGYPYKIVRSTNGDDTYTVFASLAQNIHYVLTKSERVRDKLEALHLLNGVMDLGLASRVFDSDTAVHVFNPEVDTKMSLALLNANEEEAVALLHEYAASLLYKLFDKNLHFRSETQKALLSIKNKEDKTIFTPADVSSSGMFVPVLINAVYASIAFGFSYIFEQASIKKHEGLPDVNNIHEQLLQYTGQDKSSLEKIKMLADTEIGTLRHDYLTSMTNKANKKTLEATKKIEEAENGQAILMIYKELYALTWSEDKEKDETIKIALKTSERQCIDFMERDPLKKMTNLVVKRINPQLESASFEGFAAKLKTRLAKKEEEDIHFIRQFGLTVKSLDEETKALYREYDQYDLPIRGSRSVPRPLNMACFKKMSEIQQEVLAGLANPETADEVKKTISARKRELNDYLIMVETALSMEADQHIENAVTEILALDKEGELELTVETRLETMLASSEVTSQSCRELLSLRAEKLRAEMVGLSHRLNEQYDKIKETLRNLPEKMEQQEKLINLQASMDLILETLENFSVMGKEVGIIQEGNEGLKQVKELQALRDTAYSFHKKFWYNFEELQTVMHQTMARSSSMHHENARFEALNSAMGSFLDSTRQAKVWKSSFDADKENEKTDKLVDAIRQVALARLQVKRLFRTGEALRLYQRAAGVISPELNHNNLNEFIKEITSFEKWKKWGLGGEVMTFNIEGIEQKYRLPHGIYLMWEAIKEFDLAYNKEEKCFELPKDFNKKESDSEGEGELRQGKVY